MKKADYLETIDLYKDPYKVWYHRRYDALHGTPALSYEDSWLSKKYDLFIDAAGSADSHFVNILEKDLGNGAIEGTAPSPLSNHAKEGASLPDFIYGDEDSNLSNPYFKPGYSPDTIDSFFYPGGLCLIDKDLCQGISESTGLKKGSYEYLRACFKKAKKVVRTPEVLYHSEGSNEYSYSKDFTESPRIAAAFKKPFSKDISAIILSKDHPKLAETCLSGLTDTKGHERLEILLIDNGSSPENREEYQKICSFYGVTYIHHPMDFNFSKLCNLGAANTKGNFLLFLNDDIEFPENQRFLDLMAEAAMRPHVGAVGVKLLYPGGRNIQHIGVSLLKSGPSHKLSGYEDSTIYQHGINRFPVNMLAVTAACLMVQRDRFLSVGGFNEKLAVAYNDTDLCLKLLEKGFYNISLNQCSLIHAESVTRKSDSKKRSAFERLKVEKELFLKSHSEYLSNGDPFYNPNLTDTDFAYRVKEPYPEETLKPHKGHQGAFLGSISAFLDDGTKISLVPPQGHHKKKFHHSLDSIEYHLTDAYGNEDYIEIRGWVFIEYDKPWEYDPFFILISGSDCLIFPAARYMREDVQRVFQGKPGAELAGIMCRVEKAAYDSKNWDSIGIGLAKSSFFDKSKLKGFAALESLKDSEKPEE